MRMNHRILRDYFLGNGAGNLGISNAMQCWYFHKYIGPLMFSPSRQFQINGLLAG